MKKIGHNVTGEWMEKMDEFIDTDGEYDRTFYDIQFGYRVNHLLSICI